MHRDAGTETDHPPRDADELAARIEMLTALNDATYQESADAVWEAALVAFRYAAAKVGATTFQESWSALRFYSEAMHVHGPFIVVKLQDALQPGRDLHAAVASFIEEQRPWLVARAAELLDEQRDGCAGPAHPDTVAHWEALAGRTPPSTDQPTAREMPA